MRNSAVKGGLAERVSRAGCWWHSSWPFSGHRRSYVAEGVVGARRGGDTGRPLSSYAHHHHEAHSDERDLKTIAGVG